MEHLTRREEVDLYEIIQKSFPKILVKDLAEHERICPVCNGLGMRIEDNIYGIKGDTSEAGKKYLFPYKHQALSFCQNCYNGVQSLCPYCGQPYKNQAYMHCDCEGQKKADEEERIRKWNEKVANAVAVDEKDVDVMLYCEEFDKYYDTVDDFFEDYAANYKDEEVYNKPERLWVTSVEKISIDAYSVIENACEGLHEDAMENIDEKDIAELEEFLDNWCKKQTGTTFYQYLQKIRLKHAYYDLIHTNMKIIDIALNHGFKNVKSFENVFKKEYHTTPTKYRKVNN